MSEPLSDRLRVAAQVCMMRAAPPGGCEPYERDLHRKDAALLGEAAAEVDRLNGLLNTPELRDFAKAVVLEAAHQRARWPSDQDEGKEPEDWFWLLGWLGGKAVRSAREGDLDKALHHTITAASALANWHAHLLGASTAMRPGIATPPGESASV